MGYGECVCVEGMGGGGGGKEGVRVGAGTNGRWDVLQRDVVCVLSTGAAVWS